MTSTALERYHCNTGLPLLIHGETPSAQALHHLPLLRIDCGEELSWPSVAWRLLCALSDHPAVLSAFPADILHTLYLEKWEHERRSEAHADTPAELFFQDPIEKDRFRRYFRHHLSTLKLRSPLCILICDLHRLWDEETIILSWLPTELPPDLGIICTTLCPEMTRNGHHLGWITAENAPSGPPVFPPYPTAYADFRKIATNTDSFRKRCTMATLAKRAILHALQESNHSDLLTLLSDIDILNSLFPLHWTLLRSAWVHLRMHTDLDLISILVDLIERLKQTPNDALLQKVGCLAKDLRLHGGLNRICNALSKWIINTSLVPDLSGCSEEFLRLNKYFERLCRTQRYDEICEKIRHELSNDALSHREKCLLLHHYVVASGKCEPPETTIKAANLYYESAYSSGDPFEVCRATLLLAHALKELKELDASAVLFRHCVEIAIRTGDIWMRISADIFRAKLLILMKKGAEAERILRHLQQIHAHLGEDLEVYHRWIELCEAIDVQGDPRRALYEAETLSSSMPDRIRQTQNVSTLILKGQMGRYHVELKDYARGEALLLEALDRTSNSPFYRRVLLDLLHLYDETGRRSDALYAIDQQLYILMRRKNHDDIVWLLSIAHDFLLKYHDVALWDLWCDQWETFFASFIDMQYMQKLFKIQNRDMEQRKTLQNALNEPNSDSDPQKTARILHKFALFSYQQSRLEATAALLSAADRYAAGGESDQYSTAMDEALAFLMVNRHPLDSALWDRFHACSIPSTLRKLSVYWKEFGRILPQNDRMTSLVSDYSDAIRQSFAEIFSMANAHPFSVIACLEDLAPLLFGSFSAQELSHLLHSMDPNHAGRLSIALCAQILRNAESDLTGMFRSKNAAETDHLIRYYEICAQFLALENHRKAPELYSDLALLYRHLRSVDDALRCHYCALDLLTKSRKLSQKFVEVSQTVETCLLFQRTNAAADLLRKALVESVLEDIHQQAGRFAGQLAELLIHQDAVSNRDEIDRLFELEEHHLREGSYYQELGKALLRQGEYYRNLPGYEDRLWGVVERAASIVKRFRMESSKPVLQSLEQASKNALLKKRQEQAVCLANAAGSYTITAAQNEDGGTFHYCCAKDPDDPVLHILYSPDAPQSIGIVMLKAVEPSALLAEYVTQWNGLYSYQLTLLAPLHTLQAVYSMQEKDPAFMAAEMRRFAAQYMMDLAAAHDFATGGKDIEQWIRKKQAISDEN